MYSPEKYCGSVLGVTIRGIDASFYKGWHNMNQEQLTKIFAAGMPQVLAQHLAEQVLPRLSEAWIAPADAVIHTVGMQYACAPQPEYYAVLLASAMNPKRGNKIHPAFPVLLSQITAQECRLLQRMQQAEVAVLDCVMCTVRKPTGGFLQREPEIATVVRELIPRLTAWTPEGGDLIGLQVCFDNLLRLGLIEIHRNDTVEKPAAVEQERYENIYLLHEALIQQTWEDALQNNPYGSKLELRLRTGRFTLSAMGRRFVRFCLE